MWFLTTSTHSYCVLLFIKQHMLALLYKVIKLYKLHNELQSISILIQENLFLHTFCPFIHGKIIQLFSERDVCSKRVNFDPCESVNYKYS